MVLWEGMRGTPRALQQSACQDVLANAALQAVLVETSPGVTQWYIDLGTISATLPSGQSTHKLAFHIYAQPEDGGGLYDYLEDGLPRWEAEAGASERYDPSKRASLGPAPDPLPVRCHCSSFKGTLSRPSQISLKDVSKEMGDLAIKDDKYNFSVCVCNDCRLSCGYPYSPFVKIPFSALKLSPDSKPLSALKKYSSSSKADRWHCGTCGALVFYDSKVMREGGIVELAAGLVDAPLGPVMREWWFKTDKVDYSEYADDKVLAGHLVKGWEKSA